MTHIKHAFRTLFRSPGFTVVAIATIAIAIGANTALFSVFDATVLHPINLPAAARLVRIWTNNKERNVAGPITSVPKYRMFADQQTVFSDIAASAFYATVLTRHGGDPEQLTSLNVTASFVPTLGWGLARGRNFTADEDKQNGPHVCLLTYEMWKTRFGGREDIVGSTIQLDGVATTVVGVLARGIPAPLAPIQVLVPWPFNPPYLTDQQLEGGAGFLQITARLKPGITLERAAAEIRSISQRYQQQFPGRLDGTNENELRTWIEEQVGPVRQTFVMLLAAVGFMLLIACANVSNLFLGRLSTRYKEIAVRLSLGASRRDLILQFLLESLVFCILAAGLGVVFAVWALHGAEQAFASQLQSAVTFSLNRLTLAFTIALSLVSSVAIGFIPALHASKVNLADVLKDNARGTSGGTRGARFRSLLIIAEVSLSVVLLVGSSLLLESFLKLQATPAGFSTGGIASAFVNASPQRYPTKGERVNFFYAVLDKLRSYPQVKLAAVTQGLPMTQNANRGVYTVFGRPVPPLAQRPIAYLYVASEDYFAMLHIPLKQGRLFQPTDVDGSPMVCLINATFAEKLFPGENPIGQFLALGQQAQNKMEIVGVVGDVKAVALNAPVPETIYSPLRQFAGFAQSIVASTDGDPHLLEGLIRSAVASIDKSQAISAFATLDALVQQSLGVQRVTAWLTGVFATIALLLSALGLYSVLAYTVTQRVGEIGIRMALGAKRADVVGLVLRQGMRLVTVGLALGLAMAAAGGRVLSTLLFDVKPLDPLVFSAVAALFAAVALMACLIPSWRASRIDALVALRND